VLTGRAARDAWEEWIACGGLGRVADPADESWMLLPQAYRNLSAVGVPPEELEPLSAAYARSWSRNQKLLHAVEPVLGALGEAGIEVLVLKGAALGPLHYGDAGARPMDDCDLLVPTGRARNAIDVLLGAGWRAGREATSLPLDDVIAARHALAFDGPDEHMLDLHWYSLWQSAPDDAFWRDSVPFTVGGHDVRALDPTDQLLHVCVHAGGPAAAPLRWLADAAMVMRSAAIDWERLVASARARRVTRVAEWALRAVRDVGIDVPARAVEGLAATRPRLHERGGHRAARNPGAHGGRYLNEWDRYRRLRALDASGPTPRGFVRHLQRVLGVRRRREILRHVAANAARAIPGRATPPAAQAEATPAATSARSREPKPSR
jgi:hypothetical protein